MTRGPAGANALARVWSRKPAIEGLTKHRRMENNMDEMTKEREDQRKRKGLVREAKRVGLNLTFDGETWELTYPSGLPFMQSEDLGRLSYWLTGYDQGLKDGYKQVACKVCHGTGEIDGKQCVECSGMGRAYSKSGTLPPPTKKQITAELVKAMHRAAKGAARRSGVCDRSGGEITALAQALVAVGEMADDAA